MGQMIMPHINTYQAIISSVWLHIPSYPTIGVGFIWFYLIYPLVGLHNYGKSQFLMGKSTINDHFQQLCYFTRGYPYAVYVVIFIAIWAICLQQSSTHIESTNERRHGQQLNRETGGPQIDSKKKMGSVPPLVPHTQSSWLITWFTKIFEVAQIA